MARLLLEKLDNSYLKCGICLDNFRSPRALPCLHSFCEECLEGWAKKNKNKGMLTCPNCMKEIPIPEEGIKGFPAHFLVNSLQETVEMEKKAEGGNNTVVCGNCNLPWKLATVRCLDCKEFMCQTCHSSHKIFKAFKDHQVVTIGDLLSRKVTKIAEERYCEKHEGEQKRYFCETCSKPVCRDCILFKQNCRFHDTVPLKEASAKQAGQLQEIIKECDETRERFQTAIKDTELVETNLGRAVDEVIKQQTCDKKELEHHLDEIFSEQIQSIRTMYIEKKTDLSKIKEGLQESLTKVESACELGTNLTNSESDFEITFNYIPTMESLQEVCALQAKPVDAALEHIQIPPLPYIIRLALHKEWTQIGQFNTQSRHLPFGITSASQTDIAVLCYDEVKVFSKSGDIKLTFTVNSGYGITFTQNGKYVHTGSCVKKMYIHDAQGYELSSFPSRDTNNTSSTPRPVTMDNQGNIIVGIAPNTVSIHSITGILISSFKTGGYPLGLAVTRDGNIAVTYNHASLRFQLVNSSGNVIKTLQKPPDVKDWKPDALCCSNRDELFVTNTGEPKGVFMYTTDGEYLGCVTTEIGESWGIAMSQNDQELFVADRDGGKVKIFQRP